MKISILTAVMVALVVAAVPCALSYADATDFEQDGISYVLEDGIAAVAGADVSGAVSIPDSVEHEGNTYPVTEIWSGAFCQNRGMTSVSIPDTVTVVGEEAFCYCVSLKEIVIPASVTDIGDSAFAHTGLESVRFLGTPEIGRMSFSYTHLGSFDASAWMSSPGYMFGCCPELKEFTCNDGSLTVKDGVLFSQDGSVLLAYPEGKGNHYEVPSGTLELADGAFAFNPSIQTVKADDGLRTVGGAFDSCIALHHVFLPDSVETIGDMAFYKTSVYTDSLPAGLRTIGHSAFSECRNIHSLTLPDGVETLGDGAFLLSGLREIVLNQGLRSIGALALDDTRIDFLVVPASVETVDFVAISAKLTVFEGTPSDITAYSIDGQFYGPGLPFEGLDAWTEKDGVYYGIRDGKASAVCCDLPEKGAVYLASEISAGGKSYPVTSISDNAFEGSQLKYIHRASDAANGRVPGEKLDGALCLPSSSIDIGERAFSGSALKEAVLGDNVKFIGERAFSGCRDLTYVSVSPEETGILVFSGCTSLEEAEIGPSAGSLGPGFFVGCTSLKYVDVGNATLSNNFFKGSGVEKVEFGPEATEIYGSYIECENLKEVVMDPDNAEYKTVDGVLYTKDGKTMQYCPMNKTGSYTVLPGTEKIAMFGFSTSKLSEIVLPDSLKVLDQLSFYNVHCVDVLTIPAGVTSIDPGAFYEASVIIDPRCDPSLIPEGCVLKDSTFTVGDLTYTVSEGFAGIVAVEGSPDTVTVPATVTYGGTEYPVWIKPDAFRGVSVEVLEIPEKITVPDIRVAGASVGCFRAADWMTAEDVRLLVSGSEVRSFEASGDVYSVREGCLMMGDTLVSCPCTVTGDFRVPDGTRQIGPEVLASCTGIRTVTVPASVEKASDTAFDGDFDMILVLESNFTDIPSYSDAVVVVDSPLPLDLSQDLIQVHLVDTDTMDAPDGFVKPEPYYVRIGSEVHPEIPEVENYDVFVMTDGQLSDQGPVYMGNSPLTTTYIFEMNGMPSADQYMLILLISGACLAMVVVAAVLSRRKF